MCFCSSDFLLFLVWSKFCCTLISTRICFQWDPVSDRNIFFRFFSDFSRRWQKGSNFFQMIKNLWPASNGSSQKKMAAAKNVRNRSSAKYDRKSVPTSFHRFLCFCFTLFHKKPSTAAQQTDQKSVKLFTGDRVFLKGSKTADFSLRFRFKRSKKNKRKSLPGVV